MSTRRVSYGLLRTVCHLVAEVPLLVVAGLQIAHGWVPTSDDAVIAWRSWDVFSAAVPLDGQFTQISTATGHPAFDLGPMQYFLLALPERVDPVHGLLWGAALLSAVLLALGIEAAWASGGPPAGALTAAGGALLTATLVESTVNLAWNPSVGVYALAAAMVAGITAASGRLGWLPVSVAAASLAAQCHVSFAAPAAAVLLVALVLGLAREHGRAGGPLLAAFFVAAACWAAPIYQELRGHPGNWSVLASSLGRHGRSVGFDLGLRGVAAATRILPTWATRPPPVGTGARFRRFEHVVYGGSASWGITAILICAVVGVAALLTGRRGLSALALVAALSGIATVWTLGSVPVSQMHYLGYYLYFVLWPVGMVMMATFVAALVTVLDLVAHHLHAPAGLGPRSASVAALGMAVVLAGGGGALLAVDMPLGSSGLFLLGWEPVRWVAEATPQADALARAHAYGPGSSRAVAVETNSYAVIDAAISQGVGYLLATKGIEARLTGSAATPLGEGLFLPSSKSAVVVHVSLTHGHPATAVSWKPAKPSG